MHLGNSGKRNRENYAEYEYPYVDFAVGGLTPLDEIPTIDLSPLTRRLERSALHEHLLKNVEAKVLDPLDIPHEMGVSQCDASIRPGPSGRYSASCIQCATAT